MSGLGPSLAKDGRPVVVVELFTSQGCSSCPPADALLGELADNPHVIALTEAVDYWDYLGWKDDNARKAHTERQQNYAHLRGDRRIYTPQIVVNGRVHAVGSRRSEVVNSINRLSHGPGSLSVAISAHTTRNALSIAIDAQPEDAADSSVNSRDGTLYLVPFKRSVSVEIGRGENKGRSVTYHNVVTDMQPIGMWHGEALKVELPMKDLKKEGYDGCVVLLQADVGGLPGPIYGATLVDLDNAHLGDERDGVGR